MEELAVFGGKPVREKPIFYGRQYIDQEDVEAVTKVLTADVITSGPQVSDLEKHLCEITHAKYAVAVCNGTAALHLAALAAGFGEGDEVIVSSITFAASSNCVLYAGAKPVFADINPETYNIDPASIRKLITPRTKAVVAVDFTGQAVELDEIREICKEHNLLLIEDAAHAIGTTYKGKPVGSLADMTCFSFHPVKTVTAGEGGAITTNNAELAATIRALANYGSQKKYVFKYCGRNSRLDEIQAAVLDVKLKYLVEDNAHRKEVGKYYIENLNNSIVIQPDTLPYEQNVFHLFPILVGEGKRDALHDYLEQNGVGTVIHYPVAPHEQECYKKEGWNIPQLSFPIAEKIADEELSLPIGPTITLEEVKQIIELINKF